MARYRSIQYRDTRDTKDTYGEIRDTGGIQVKYRREVPPKIHARGAFSAWRAVSTEHRASQRSLVDLTARVQQQLESDDNDDKFTPTPTKHLTPPPNHSSSRPAAAHTETETPLLHQGKGQGLQTDRPNRFGPQSSHSHSHSPYSGFVFGAAPRRLPVFSPSPLARFMSPCPLGLGWGVTRCAG